MQALADRLSDEDLNKLIDITSKTRDKRINKVMNAKIDEEFKNVEGYVDAYILALREDTNSYYAEVQLWFEKEDGSDYEVHIEIDCRIPEYDTQHFNIGTSFGTLTGVGNRANVDNSIQVIDEDDNWTLLDGYVLLERLIEVLDERNNRLGWVVDAIERQIEKITDKKKEEEEEVEKHDFTEEEFTVYQRVAPILTANGVSDVEVKYFVNSVEETCELELYGNETKDVRIHWDRLYYKFPDVTIYPHAFSPEVTKQITGACLLVFGKQASR